MQIIEVAGKRSSQVLIAKLAQKDVNRRRTPQTMQLSRPLFNYQQLQISFIPSHICREEAVSFQGLPHLPFGWCLALIMWVRYIGGYMCIQDQIDMYVLLLTQNDNYQKQGTRYSLNFVFDSFFAKEMKSVSLYLCHFFHLGRNVILVHTTCLHHDDFVPDKSCIEL